MNATAAHLCKNIQGAKLAYVQSDEISIVMTDFDELGTDMWFDGNIQKMASVSSSLATSFFNDLRIRRYFGGPHNNIATEGDLTIGEHFVPGTNLEEVRDDIASFINYLPLGTFKLANFDSRVFQIHSLEEVCNYFVWRQQDATRNSISSVAQSLYSHKELEGKSTNEMQGMILAKDINWNDFSYREKRGAAIVKVNELWKRTKGNFKEAGTLVTDKEQLLSTESSLAKSVLADSPYEFYNRGRWKAVETPIFTQETNFLIKHIPSMINEPYEV